jgi:hypothetical protein
MHYLLTILFIFISIEYIHSEVTFRGLCLAEAEVQGLQSVDGNDDFEIDLYETQFLPDETVLCKKKKPPSLVVYYYFISSGN